MQFMWHCNVKSSSPTMRQRQWILARKAGKGEKVLPFKAVRGVQTLYMTDRMKIWTHHAAANRPALRLSGV
jgi:hypothetical protein